MRSIKSVVKATAVLAAAALALTACGGGTEANKEAAGDATGELNVFAAYDTTNWHPSNTSSALAVGANLQVVEGLYEFDYSTFKAHKALAADDPKEVGDLTYEVALRDGAKFSTGDPVTSEDVVASYKRIVDGEKDSQGTDVTSPYAAFITFIDSIEAKDDSTVTIKLNQPQDYLKERLANVKVIPASATFDEMTSKPVGSGPYKYDEITDTTVDMSVNEHYNGDNPATVAKIHYDCDRDSTVRLTAALGGSTDIVENVDPSGIKQLEGAGWKVDEVTAYGIAMITFNTTKAPFDKKETRQGVITAIDTQTLIDTALAGAGQEPKSFLPESNDMYKEAATQFTFDVDKAKELLKKGGAEGATVNVLATTDTWIAAMGPQIQQNLEAAGLKVNLKTLASADVWNNNVAQGDFDIVIAPGDASVFGADPGVLTAGWFFSPLWMDQRYRLSESDPETTKALVAAMDEAGKATGDDAKAKWGEVQDMIADQAALYPLVFHTLYTAYNPEKVENLTSIGVTGLQLIGTKVK
ncbi:MAG: ABC transporter substrate-binding protein [Varibaculum sp.]|nr:ABC transporter substrate-binding protein [Varibaculum sp.]